jgi:hypothetical protein
MHRLINTLFITLALSASAEPAVRWLVVHTNGTVCPSGYVATPADVAAATSGLADAASLALIEAQTNDWNTAYRHATNIASVIYGTNQWIDGDGIVRVEAVSYTVAFTGNIPPGHPEDGSAFPFSAATWSGSFSGTDAVCQFTGDPGTPFDDRTWTAAVTGSWPLDLQCLFEGYGTCIVSRVVSTNILGTLARIDQVTAAQAGAVSTNDTAYLSTVSLSASALQPAATNGLASTAWTTAQIAAATNGLGSADASITNGLASIAYVVASTSGLVRASITNGLASLPAATNAARAVITSNVYTNMLWGSTLTNATYRMSWDATNGTFKVEEIFQ